MRKLLTLCALAALAAPSFASVTLMGPATRDKVATPTPRPANEAYAGDSYSVGHLLGNTSNVCYFQSAGPDTVPFDGLPNAVPTHLTNGVTPVVTETEVQVGANPDMYDVSIITTGNGDLYPGGFVGSQNEPLPNICYFIGLDDMLDSSPLPAKVVAAQISLTDATGATFGPFALNPATFFGAPGPWNGFVGIAFNGGAGIGIVQTRLDLRTMEIPEPSTVVLGSLGALALVAIARRRIR